MNFSGLAHPPLFVRVFLVMLICVGVVQLMNVALLVAVQPPSARVSSVADIADAIERGDESHGAFLIERRLNIDPLPWNPRADRVALTLATALGVPFSDVKVRFPPEPFRRATVYSREGVPEARAPSSRAAAREGLVIGEFIAQVRQPDGSWLEVRSDYAFEPWRWFVLLWLILSAAAVAPFAWALAQRLTKPIGVFAEAAERLGRDPRAAPIPVDGPPEIADAASAFNQMQARLNRYVDDRATVVGAVAHDLRTPLMRLNLRLEDAPDPLRRACEQDIRDMQAMLSATLSYVHDTNTALARRPLDLRSLAETVIDQMSDRGEAVSLVPGAPLVMDGNSAGLKALIENLVGNAVKYAGGAEVTIDRDAGHARIIVRDSGPGMQNDDIDRAFEPFFRGERSRNPDTGGLGLGLASVRAVARAHGGDVTLQNQAQGGLAAEVKIPL